MKLEDITGELIQGLYIAESKRRFSCEIEIDGKIEKCYVASSSKLEQFVPLKTRKVKVSKSQSNSKFKYTLWSVNYEGKEILLNLKKVNDIIEALIKKENLLKCSYVNIKKEKVVNNLKTDLILEKSNIVEIVEIKACISINEKAIFPNLNSTRALEQLIKLEKMLEEGYKVKYIIAALSPFVKQVVINQAYEEYKEAFNRCINLGMETIVVKLEQIEDRIKYSIIEL